MAHFRLGHSGTSEQIKRRPHRYDALSVMRRFGRNEDGTLVIFALMMTLLMLMMGGIAVDLMRYETRRTSLQNTLDRSTLAAASLTQNLNPTAVVNDYFLRAGLSQYLRSVKVTEGLNFRNVSAKAVADSQPLFLHMMGINEFDAAGASAAEQRINNVEIMLVLDVSGSMASNSKIQNLKIAAKNFVSTVLAKDAEHKISIGIVPFNGQVNLGPTLINYYNVVDKNGLPNSTATQAGVNCVDLPASVYATYAIPQTTPLSMTSNADTYSGTGTATPNEANKWCPVTNTAVSPTAYYTGNPAGSGGNMVRLPQQDVATLQGYIDGLSAVGATSINAGVKWGMTLLDPSSQNIYTTEIAAARMPNTMATRPLAYDAKDAMKVIVLMTDGENFPEDRVNTAGTDPAGLGVGFKVGISPFWQGTSDSKWSMFAASKVNSTNATNLCNSRPYYVPTATTKWQSRPWNGTTPGTSDCYVPVTTTPATGATQRTWPDVWSKMGVQYVAATFYQPALGGSTSTYINLFRTQTDTSTANTPTMDSQMQTACTAAKNNGVIVYGIAFEAPTNGQAMIRQCATSDGHYFVANGSQIGTAFTAIANNISQLRLTQ